jgi:hypothetical protein
MATSLAPSPSLPPGLSEDQRIRWVFANRLGSRVSDITDVREACLAEGVWSAQDLVDRQNRGLNAVCRKALKGRDASGLPFAIPSYGISKNKPDGWVQLGFASADEAIGYEDREWERAGDDVEANLKVHDYNLARFGDAAPLPLWLTPR